MQGTVQFGFFRFLCEYGTAVSGNGTVSSHGFTALGRHCGVGPGTALPHMAGSEISAAHMGALYAFRPIQRAASGICVECPQKRRYSFSFFCLCSWRPCAEKKEVQPQMRWSRFYLYYGAFCFAAITLLLQREQLFF